MCEQYDECVAEMPKKIIIGSVNGKLVESMENLIRNIYPAIFDNQFQDPHTANNNLFSSDEIQTEDDKNIVVLSESSIDVSRPSDFRLKALFMANQCNKSEISQRNSLSKENINVQQNSQKHLSNSKENRMQKYFDYFINRFSDSIEW